MNRLACKAILAIVVLDTSACTDSAEEVVRAGKVRQALGYVSAPNPYSEAIALRSFPNHEDRSHDKAWRIVLAEPFNKAVEEQSNKQSDLSETPFFFSAAGVANDGWTRGLASEHGDWVEMATAKDVSGTNWVVAEQLQVDEATGTLFVTDYRLVNLPLTLKTRWKGNVTAAFVHLGASGTSRCCGPEKLCDSEGGPVSPHCPNGYCDDGTQIFEGVLGIADQRLHAGLSYIPAQTFESNQLFGAGCLPARDNGCFNQTPICDQEVMMNPPWGSWQASVPLTNGACGSLGDRPVSGRVVPKHCLYRNDQIQAVSESYKGGGFQGKAPDCDGQCFECETHENAADSNGRPRQCDLMKPLPGDPPGLPGSPGSGVCTSTAASAGLEQIQLRLAAGVGVGSSGKGACETRQIPDQPDRYVELCIECSPTECHRTAAPANSWMAHGAANQNTPTPCNATQANCTPPPAGSGGGTSGGSSTGGGAGGGTGGGGAGAGSAGGGVPNPPISSTSSPTPAQKRVPTDKPKPRANDTRNGPEKSVQKKQEKGKDPIGLLSGAFELRHVDLSFPGAVRPLEFVRTYDSQSRDRSVLGSNWNHNWDVRVVPLNDENRPSWADPYCAGSPHETTCIMLYVGDAPQLYYREFMTGTFVPQNGASTGTLVPLASTPGTPDSRTGWMLESADGHNLTFDADGYLTRDVDRFGNGFSIEYELTANGRLFSALCPPGIVEMAPNPADPSSIIIRPQQGPVYSSETLDCRALGSVSGVRAPIARRPTGSPTLHFQLPPQPAQALSDAKALVERLQNTNGRQPGSPMPWGARLKRVTRVKEITATNGSTITATGRELAFEYFGTSSNLVGSSSLTSEGLLRAVTGPAGARIEFTYGSAEGVTNHPVFLNEAFLTEAKRNDGTNTAGVSPTPVRSLRFTYAWLKNTLAGASITQIRSRYEAFLLAQVNCTYTPVDNCGQKRPPALIETDVSAELDDIEASYRAEVVDNIIRVEDGSVVESETRYDIDPFSHSFDRTVRQRWGSTYADPMPSSAPDWDTTLPEGELRFAEAAPLNEGQDDLTTAFLPPAIRDRYALEPIPTGAPFASARASGLLLAPNSPDGTVIPGQNPPLAEGTLVPAVGNTRPACALQKLPVLRSRLPGYRPSFEYYDLGAQTPDADSATQGINVETFELRRSRLSCDVLTRAQTYDARSNDLLWTWQNDANGQMVANRSLGRRKFITLNANRICAWVHDIDRDGNSKYVGLNFQGRPLVDAAKGSDGVWRFAETLYNADGNVIAQRRPLPEGTAWNASRGDTRYSYLDTVQPSNPAQPLPWHWARRGNVIRVTERPRGGTVQEAVEAVGSTSTVTSRGRYTKFVYEPLFNQVHKIEQGWLDGSNAEQLTLTTETVYDYQEGPVSNLLPILARQVKLGFSWATNGSFSLLLTQIANQLAVPMGVGDVNGDGAAGLTGLPSVVYLRPASGGQEVVTYRWNRGGRLIWMQGADGAVQAPGASPSGGPVLTFEYFALGTFSGSSSANNTGLLALKRHHARRSWSSSFGPSIAPCPHLPGPYQWLLPASCSSSNLASQLVMQRHIPQQLADAIVAEQAAAKYAFTGREAARELIAC